MPRTVFAPSPSQLRAFCKVADLGSITAAAAEVGTSQSALSQALSTLESGFGAELVRRGPRRADLTAEGLRMLPFARTALAAIDAMVAVAADPDAPVPLRLGIIPTAAPYVVTPLIEGMAATGGRFRPFVIEEQTADLVDAVRSGEADAALVALPVSATGLREFPLYREDFVLAVPPEHRFADAGHISPAELDEETMLLLDRGHCLREQTLDFCRDSRARILGAAESRISGLATALRCVGLGMGVTVLPATAAAAELPGTRARAVEFDAPSPGRTMGLITRAAVPEELIRVLREVVGGPAFAGVPVTPVAEA